MSDFQQQVDAFIRTISESDTLWALQSGDDDWVVCDSSEFEQTDVMPLWSTQEAAQANCVDEWADYQPAAIALDDFFEYWVADLNDDGVLVGIDWPASADESVALPEVDPIVLIKQMVGDQGS